MLPSRLELTSHNPYSECTVLKKKCHGLSPRVNYTDQAPLIGEVMPTFADRGCHVVNVTDSYGRILGFLDSRYFSIK
jgi:CBS-domain-containing membrane protein